jgi:hypothetical protein
MRFSRSHHSRSLVPPAVTPESSTLLPYFDEGKIVARFRTDRTLRKTAPDLPMIKC